MSVTSFTYARIEAHTVLATAAVDLESVLVCEDVYLDTSEVARQSSDWSFSAPVIGSILVAVHEVAVIVSGAVETTVTEELRSCEICAELLRA